MATPRVHELFAQVMSGRFVPDTSHEWGILVLTPQSLSTVKLGNKERFDKEQIGIKEPFPVTNLPFTS